MSKFGFDKILTKFQTMKRDLPPIIGNMAVRYFVKSFSDQAWEGKAWKEVKRRLPGTPAYKYPKGKDLERRNRMILIGKSGGTGSGSHPHLRASVNNSLKKAEWSEILFTVPQVYAKRHNEGLDGMPKRQFIGHSNELIGKIRDRINIEMKGVMKV